MRANIDSLDDLCLLVIFDRLPNEDLLRVGRVCRRWNFIQRKSAFTRKLLCLHLGPQALGFLCVSLFDIPFDYKLVDRDSKDHKMLYPESITVEEQRPWQKFHRITRTRKFSLNFAKLLVRLFPNVRALTVCVRTELDHVTHVGVLLKGWSRSLSTLKLYTNFADQDERMFQRNARLRAKNIRIHKALLRNVNKIGALKRLTIDLNSSLLSNDNDTVELPVLGQLELFHFACEEFYSVGDYLANPLVRYGQGNDQLKNIQIINSILDLDKYLRMTPEFAANFRRVVLELDEDNSLALYRFANRFNNLTSLQLIMSSELVDITPELIYGAVARLPRLVNLALYTDCDSLQSIAFFEPPDDQKLKDLQSKSVRVLTVCLNRAPPLSSHLLSRSLYLHKIFPYLQVLVLNREVVLCGECSRKRVSLADYEEKCLRPFLKPFWRCTELYTINTKNPYKEWLYCGENEQEDEEENIEQLLNDGNEGDLIEMVDQMNEQDEMELMELAENYIHERGHDDQVDDYAQLLDDDLEEGELVEFVDHQLDVSRQEIEINNIEDNLLDDDLEEGELVDFVNQMDVSRQEMAIDNIEDNLLDDDDDDALVAVARLFEST